MRDVLSNIRYSFRQFRNAPVFTSAAVLTVRIWKSVLPCPQG